MLSCELVKPHDLTAADIACWRDMQAQTDAFKSPILSPDFALAVAQVRNDVQVAVFRDGAATIGFLAHHRRPDNFARPAGAPFADYTALLTFPQPRITIAEALKLAQIDQFQVIGLIDPHGVFGEVDGFEDEAFGIDLTHDEPVNNVNKKQTKNINRLRRHMQDGLGEIKFIVGDRNEDHYATMLRLKRDQVRQSGLHDFLAPAWVQRFLRNLFEAPRDGLYGQLVTFTAGDIPLLYHYGVRLGDRAHPWVSSFDPAYATNSPGQIFLNDLQGPLKADGIAYYDLSTGQQHYKSSFCNTSFKVKNSRVFSDSPRARLNETVAALTQKALPAPLGNAFARLDRRLDQIASLELDFPSRARGVAYAFSNMSKRLRPVDNG